MLTLAKAKLAKRKLNSTIHLIQGDAQHLPFPDATFDCATITYALRNVSDITRTFAEMARVVRPGGRVVSLELTRPPPGACFGSYIASISTASLPCWAV